MPNFSCISCGQVFQKKIALKKHRDNKHPHATTFKVGEKDYEIIQGNQEGSFVCQMCGCQLSGKNSLRRHVVKCSQRYARDSEVESASEQSLSTDDGNSDEQTMTPNDRLSLGSLGLQVDQQWKVATCNHCHYIIDPPKIIQHITKAHKMHIPNTDLARNIIDAANLRPHLAVLSNDHDDDDDDDNNDGDNAGFLHGSAAVKGLPVHAGFKCLICLDVCTLKASSMRAHIARHHPKEPANCAPVSVQVFYDRTVLRPQLCYVEVTEPGEPQPRVSTVSELLGIPVDLDDVGGHDMAVEARDRNQFGEKFGAYYLIEMIDFEELNPWFLKPTMKGFDVLRELTVAYIQDCWAHVKSGFQPLQAKIMKYDNDKQFFHAVQQQETVVKYGEIWAKVLWLGCMAVMYSPPSIATGMTLTNEQSESATRLLLLIENIAPVITGEHSSRISELIIQLSASVLCQESDTVNFTDDNGVGLASQLLVPRAINLLSLRPNGTFAQYGQITHIAAAITYCIRSTFIYTVSTRVDPASRSGEAIDNDIQRFLNPAGSTPYGYCVQVHGACRTYGSKHVLPTITWANSHYTALRLATGELLTVASLKSFVQELLSQCRNLVTELSFDVKLPRLLGKDMADNYGNRTPGYSFVTEKRNRLNTRLLFDALQSRPELQAEYVRGGVILRAKAEAYAKKAAGLLGKLFMLMHLTYGSPARMTEVATWLLSNSVHSTRSVYCHPRGLIFLGRYNKTTSMTGHERMIVHVVPQEVEVLFLQYFVYIRTFARDLIYAIYKARNGIIVCYNQYIFTGTRGRWHAENLRRVIREQSGQSEYLLTSLTAQSLRQTLVALLDRHAGHLSAVTNAGLNYVEDIQGGHTSHVATTYYAIGTDDLPGTNRNDIHEFMNVSDRWIAFLGLTASTVVADSITGVSDDSQGGNTRPSAIGQSITQPIPATSSINPGVTQTTTIIREVTEIYTEVSNADLLPVAPATFTLLRHLRGGNAKFRGPYQGAAVQTVISNPGYSYLVVLPTGGGKSDILFLSALYERQNGRITLLVLPFVALRYDLLDRGRKLGLRITEWSSNIKRESIIESDIIVISIESIDSGIFRSLLTELLISKEGNSLVARIFFDEAHTILGHWDFRPSFQAITNLTSLSIPVVLLSATVPPGKVDRIRKAYNRLDLRIIRAPSTMRLNIAYSVTHVPGNELRDNLRATITSYFSTCQPTDRALVFCMSVAMTEDLYNDFRVDQDRIHFYHGQLKTEQKAIVFEKWIKGDFALLFCTSGFGVGIDYGSVTLAIHYEGFWNLLDFAQESGRVGRNNKPARSLVLLRANWSPNLEHMLAQDAQPVLEYISEHGYCRRFVLGKYMDGSGFSCLTYPNAELCDKCKVTQGLLIDEDAKPDAAASSPINKHASLQYPEGPIPVIKRIKADMTYTMKEKIMGVFTIIITDYGECALCAIEQAIDRHRNYHMDILLKDHNVEQSVWAQLDDEFTVSKNGSCHGCGLSLLVVNSMSEHIPSRTCIYSMLVRLICYDIFMTGKISSCLTNMEPGFLDARDIKSFGRWLKVCPLGESVNNLTRMLYNWAALNQLVQKSSQTQRTERDDGKSVMTDDRRVIYSRAASSHSELVEGSSQRQRRVRVGGEALTTEDGGVKSTIAEKWLQFMNIIRTEFHGCSVCAMSKVQQRHGADDSFNQMLRAHGYHDVNQFMQFERMTYFNQSQAKAICLNCSLPRRLTSSMPSHQGRVCPSPRVTRALCYVAWTHRVISRHVEGIDVSSLDPSNMQSFATWLTTASAENPEVFNMTHFVVNMMQSTRRV